MGCLCLILDMHLKTKKIRGMGSKLVLILMVLLAARCNKKEVSEPGKKTILQFTIKPKKENQTIQNFGASDCWSTQFVGKGWLDKKKGQIADLLFSKELKKDGSPKGIALSCWRFNVGGGSMYQGAASNINDEWRRAGCFLEPDGSYNWDNQMGQRWFLQAAKNRDVGQFIAFSNSPPVNFTKNGLANSSGGSSINLKKADFQNYATFLADVVENISQKEGILFTAISPFNEPQWDWKDGQEGSPWLNSEISEVCKLLDAELAKRKLSTEIEVTEAGQLEHLYKEHDKPGRTNQIDDFFSPASPNYIGGLSHISHQVAGHSYWTTYGTDKLINTRQLLKEKIDSHNLAYAMSEYCILENNEVIKGNGRDLGMGPALYVARLVHADLVVANAVTWQWWLAISPYDYKDGLVYIDKNKTGGLVYVSKLLWGLGNFSRFIRPGMKRVDVERTDNKSFRENANGLFASAYKSGEESKLVVVLVNMGHAEEKAVLNIDTGKYGDGKMYLTASGAQNNLKYIGDTAMGKEINILPRSILTVVF